jgi:hypothetical protein
VAPVISSGVLQKHQCHSKEYGKYKEGQRTTKVDMDNIGKKRLGIGNVRKDLALDTVRVMVGLWPLEY